MTDIQSQFPGLRSETAYLDNAATTQICAEAIDAMTAYLRAGRANVGRSLYPMAEVSVMAYEEAHKTIASFVDADASSTVFTKSVTEGINAIAFGVTSMVNAGDEILVSPFEHHANLLPWRRLARERGASVRTMPMTNDYMLDVDGAVAMMHEKTKIIAVTMVSNVLGTIVPVRTLIDAAQVRTPPPYEGGGRGAVVILDAAQAAPHIPISMRDLGADAIVFGSHKCYGPSGIAAMVLSPRLASRMEPTIVGGGMVDAVGADSETWRDIPARFEGGSPNVEGAVGFAAALSAFPLLPEEGLGVVGDRRQTGQETAKLRSRITSSLRVIPGVTVLDPRDAVGIVSFTVDGIHPHDVADLLGQRGVCVRAGHHCAQPLVDRIAPNGGTIRVSLAVYSTESDVDRFLVALREVISMLKPDV